MSSSKEPPPKQSSSLREELRSLGALIFNTEQIIKEIAFYSSQAQYISYYQGLLDELVDRGQEIVYLTSDSHDPILSEENAAVTSFFSKSFLQLTFPALTSPILITTIPDLHQYKIKRAFLGTNYVYVFHSLVSTHMMYRKGAFDFYDTIFCVGPHHVNEIRKTEQLYGKAPKALHEVGYYRLEKIHAESFLGQRFVYTKVIVITAYFELKYVRQVMSAGAFDFIVKPVKMEDLRGSIGRAVYEISKFKSLARRCEECEQLKRKTTKIFETPEENRKQ